MACTKRPKSSSCNAPTNSSKRVKRTPAFEDDEVITCGADESKAQYAWVHFHGYGESALQEYLLDENFQLLLRDFPSVRAYIPMGGESTTYQDGTPLCAYEGWGDYLSDKKGLDEDELDSKTLRTNTEKAHGLLAKLSETYGKKLLVSGYSMGFGFAVHVLATLPAGIEVTAFIGVNGMITKSTEPHLTNLPKRCKSFTVQWATPLPMEAEEPSDEGDYFFRQWAQDATRRRFKSAGLANKVVYEPDLPEGHSPATRCTTLAIWLKSAGVVRGLAPIQPKVERKRSFGLLRR
jgi:pimeloyl-ACP methyl ester carboxylesterase